MNRGSLGARALNVAPQAALNPEAQPRIERFGWTYAPGDKVIQLATQHDTLLQRNLLYTAVTRGKRLVVLIAQPKALAMAVKQTGRWTQLRERLAEG